MTIANLKTPILLSLLTIVSAQAQSGTDSEERILPIVDASNLITRASSCHALGRELNLDTHIHFPDLTESIFKSLDNAGWSSQDVAEALTWSQEALPEIPSNSEESQHQYLTRLYDSKFRCNDIDRAYSEKVAASIPENPEIMK
mgnify:CR=1 FL=1